MEIRGKGVRPSDGGEAEGGGEGTAGSFSPSLRLSSIIGAGYRLQK
ncbi:MAG: hypothetical protein LUH21_21360 [Clostridiales bacterium]|nr:MULTISPECIES: hypothetical protein [Hungatella]MBT9799053.1 hypothetical protein [Hungatella hathewayi]MCD7999774.1 hypothetical protein [Clostridiales bacterium]MCI7384130.1 hypothetical protein [Hungatella sp.]MDY6238022.1 hypothetical protein [Hungatella hathewayi]